MEADSNYQEQVQQLIHDLSKEGRKLVKEVAKIEKKHRHKSRPTGIADEIVNVVKGLVK